MPSETELSFRRHFYQGLAPVSASVSPLGRKLFIRQDGFSPQ
ncbi:hypothetical protein NEILACOT_04701 [Neisseria lactamica ATCC 23970]|uniref:Uncharacterized protein n=1 Tax=Neisseria lactamica ATCC 23970 TaxID=546265 RepID=D0WAX8_NEILA|nr:hypothetical protein NEILACOT_04701 [Neisseria lactamica ATCC 23970]